MGMFDTISVSDSLPYSEEMLSLGFVNKKSFQTKDLGKSMAHYAIQDGLLYIEKYKNEEWIEGDKDSRDFLSRLGHLERTGRYLEIVPHHGIISFYEYHQDVDGKWDCWVEFDATFTNGKVEKIELAEFRKESNTERLANEARWQAEITARNNLWYNKYFFDVRPVRWFFSRVWYRAFTKLGNFFTRIAGFYY
jgi:hypothetical protein